MFSLSKDKENTMSSQMRCQSRAVLLLIAAGHGQWTGSRSNGGAGRDRVGRAGERHPCHHSPVPQLRPAAPSAESQPDAGDPDRAGGRRHLDTRSDRHDDAAGRPREQLGPAGRGGPAPAGAGRGGRECVRVRRSCFRADREILLADEARRLYEQIVNKVLDPALLEFAGYNLVRSSVFPVPAAVGSGSG